MTTLNDIMTGRSLQDEARSLLAGAALRAGARRGDRAPAGLPRRSSTSSRSMHIRKLPVGALPYGLQKRVELGRALAMEPTLLLLNEPMAGMNLEEKEDMSRFIVEANRLRGATIALIEHDIGVVMDLSDQVVVLEYGRKIADGVPDVVKADQTVIDAYLGVRRLGHGPPARRFRRPLRPDDRRARSSGADDLGRLRRRRPLFADRARLRAHLQGLRRVQLRARDHDGVRGADPGRPAREGRPGLDRAPPHGRGHVRGWRSASSGWFCARWSKPTPTSF